MTVKDGDFSAAIDAQMKRQAEDAVRAGLEDAMRNTVTVSAAEKRELLDRYGLRASPHPDASKRYPVTPMTIWVEPLAADGRREARRLGRTVATFIAVAVATVFYWGLARPRLSDGAFQFMLISTVMLPVMAWRWGSSRQPRVELEGCLEDQVAQVPGFCGDEPITVSIASDGEPIEPNEVLVRDDGVAYPAAGVSASAKADHEIDLPQVGWRARSAPSEAGAEAGAATIRQGELALLRFASEIERALALTPGSVWVTYTLLDAADRADERPVAKLVNAVVLVQGSRRFGTERVCDAVVQARDRVLAEFECFPVGAA